MISRLHAFRLLAASGLLAITPFALVVSGRSSQAQDPKPAADLRFEVASVKLNPPTIAEYLRSKGGDRSALLQSMGIQTMPGGRVLAMFATLRSLVLQAFDIKEYQLEGGPDWINTSRFEIDARANRAATPQELNTMLKALLVERFALRTRTEVRQVRQFELKVARDDGKLGPSLKPTAAACLAEIEERRRNPGPRPPRPSANSPEEGRAQMRTPE